MAEGHRNALLALIQQDGNSECADCGEKKVDWASAAFGVFLCQACAGIHRGLTSPHSRIKSLYLDKWDEDQVQIGKFRMDGYGMRGCHLRRPQAFRNLCASVVEEQRHKRADMLTLKKSIIETMSMDRRDILQTINNSLVMRTIGNNQATLKYEQHVPVFYKKPTSQSVYVLQKEWIIAKYQRLEFIDPAKQTAYDCETKTGFLWKLGRDRKQFAQRRFVLSRTDNTLCYYVNEDSNKQRQPKSVVDLDFLNAVFVPEKIGNPFGLQLTYIRDGSTRSLFLYSDTSKEIVDWFMCIRAAKWERRKIAFPDRNVSELSEDLTNEFLMEGWLSKMGPKNEPFKRRWFTLDCRKLMYFEEPLHAYAKGEVFIGHKDAGYRLSVGGDVGYSRKSMTSSGSNCCFTLHTPDRNFVMRAESRDDMEKWVMALERVIEQPLTPYDSKLAALLVAKKASGTFRLIKR